MAIDPRISLFAQAPKAPPSPFETAIQGETLKGLVQAGQEGQIKLEAARAQQRENEIIANITRGEGTPAEKAEMVRQEAPLSYNAYMTERATLRQKISEADEQDLELREKKADEIYDQISSFMATTDRDGNPDLDMALPRYTAWREDYLEAHPEMTDAERQNLPPINTLDELKDYHNMITRRQLTAKEFLDERRRADEEARAKAKETRDIEVFEAAQETGFAANVGMNNPSSIAWAMTSDDPAIAARGKEAFEIQQKMQADSSQGLVRVTTPGPDGQPMHKWVRPTEGMTMPAVSVSGGGPDEDRRNAELNNLRRQYNQYVEDLQKERGEALFERDMEAVAHYDALIKSAYADERADTDRLFGQITALTPEPIEHAPEDAQMVTTILSNSVQSGHLSQEMADQLQAKFDNGEISKADITNASAEALKAAQPQPRQGRTR